MASVTTCEAILFVILIFSTDVPHRSAKRIACSGSSKTAFAAAGVASSFHLCINAKFAGWRHEQGERSTVATAMFFLAELILETAMTCTETSGTSSLVYVLRRLANVIIPRAELYARRSPAQGARGTVQCITQSAVLQLRFLRWQM